MQNFEDRDPHVLWTDDNNPEELKVWYYALLETGIKPDRIALQITLTDEDFEKFLRAISKRVNNHSPYIPISDGTTATIDIHCRKGLWEMIL